MANRPALHAHPGIASTPLSCRRSPVMDADGRSCRNRPKTAIFPGKAGPPLVRDRYETRTRQVRATHGPANYDATLNVISGRRPKQPCIGIWSQRPRDQPGLVIWLGAPGPDVNSGFWLKVPREAGLLYTCGHPASPDSVGIWFFHPDPGPVLFLPSP